MVDDLVLYVDRLITSPTLEPINDVNVTMPPTQILGKQNVVSSYQVGSSKKIDEEGSKFVECEIYQEEDIDKSMEIPCACTGSMKLNSGKVVAVGPGARSKEGNTILDSFKEGDHVLLPEYGGNEIKLGDKEYHLYREDDILGILQD